MLGMWMKDVNERWDTQSYTGHKYLQWNNELKHKYLQWKNELKHDRKLFGYLKFKFKTCLELTLFR